MAPPRGLLALLAAATAASCAAASAASVGPDGAVASECPPPPVKSYGDAGAARILASHNVTCAGGDGLKRFAGEALAYVTPWNSRGYDVAKRFGAKFTYVSPVWLQLRDAPGGGVEVTGTHDIDAGWVADVRAGCRGACSVLPRLIFEARTLDVAASVRAVAGVVQRHGFDGVVLEVPLQHPAVRAQLVPQLAAALAALPSAPLGVAKLVLVVGPGGLAPDALAALAAHAHRFSVMTYDHSSSRGQPGPNSPLRWVADTMAALLPPGAPASLRRQLLVGVPFYGYDARDAILGHRWLELLAQHTPRVKLDAKAAEHYVTYTDAATGARRTVYYPTPWMLQARLALAAAEGYGGVAVWEVGQGLDEFMDWF